MRRAALTWLGALSPLLFCIGVADAQVSIRGLKETHPLAFEQLLRTSHQRPLLVRLAEAPTPAGNTRSSAALLPLGRRYGLWLDTETSLEEPVEAVFWGPPKRLFMDRARASVRAEEHRAFVSRQGFLGTGRGVAIGIVDSGVDLSHPDLRNADGGTRVAWMLEFGAGPYGFFPEVEQQLGCGTKQMRCGVLSATQIDVLLTETLRTDTGDRVRMPQDVLGHGTHVASLAAGNGASSSDYLGLAPEATLIVAQVAQNSVSVSDADMLVATRFVFDRAAELNMPSVVNLSLGGDFGPHDGASEVGLALADLLEASDSGPGRAIVVAAGNSATLYEDRDSPYPGPHGIHTSVHIPEGTSQRVPILLPPGQGNHFGSVFVWLSFAEGDEVSVGLEEGDGTVAVAPVSRGQAQTVTNGELTVSVINSLEASLDLGEARDYAAVVVIDGKLALGSVYALRLEGRGEAKLWLQSDAGLGAESGTPGALFPRATRSNTINIPADTEDLIAVGATLNRLAWPGRDRNEVELALTLPGFDDRLNSVSFFSSAGPNGVGGLKPDLVAPGLAVIGAMSAAADPARSNPSSMFGFSALCQEFACAVASDRYAVALGTSMAAPIVTGAAALLFEQEPRLKPKELRSLLQAGASDVNVAMEGDVLGATRTQTGAGLLNVLKSAQALQAKKRATRLPRPSPLRTRLTLSDEYARPKATARVSGLLHLRDAKDELADAEPSDLELRLTNGAVVEGLRRVAPGLYEFAVAAQDRTSGELLQVNVTHRGTELSRVAIPIAVDHGVFSAGVTLRGGCEMQHAAPNQGGYLGLGWVLWLFSWVMYRVYPWRSQGA